MLCLLLQYFSWRRWHQSTLSGLVLALEIVTHFLERHPLNAFVLVDIVNDPGQVSELIPIYNCELPLMHQQYVRLPTDIRMNGHREAKLIIILVEVIEVISP